MPQQERSICLLWESWKKFLLQRSMQSLVWQWVGLTIACSLLCRHESCCDAFQLQHHGRVRVVAVVSYQQRPFQIRGSFYFDKALKPTLPTRKMQKLPSLLAVYSTKSIVGNPRSNLHHSAGNIDNNQQDVSLTPELMKTEDCYESVITSDHRNATLFHSELDAHFSQQLLQKQQIQHQDSDFVPALSSNEPIVHDHLTAIDKLVVTATILVGSWAFCSLIRASGPGAWRYYLSGGVCAATSHAIPTPIDVVKTRKQVDPALRDKNFIEAANEIIQKEGVRALLAGLGPTTWGYLLEGAVKFGVYENLKPSLTRLVASMAGYSSLLSLVNPQVLAFFLCGAVSGTAAAIAVCPMEALRIRMVAEPQFAPKGWLDGGYKILKYEGVSGLWKGMTPMLYKQVPYTVMKNVSFDFLTRFFYAIIRTGGYTVNAATKFSIPFLSAMIASILSCISSQPGDMLLSLVNAHNGTRRTNDFVQDILKSEQGFRGFFVGTKTRLLHVGMIVTLQLLVYDFVKRLCGVAATGSV